MNRKKITFSVVGILVIGGILANVYLTLGTTDTITATVNKTESIVVSRNDTIRHKYLVFTNRETLENTDSILHGKFNSSDIQGRLKEGKTYRFKVYGWRVPFLSQYRNIIKVTEKSYAAQ